MNVAEIKPLDVANGLGVRVSLFVSGCRNRCKGCFNECAWDFSYGTPFDSATEERLITLLASPHVAGLSVLGGDPFEEENQAVLAPFLEKVKSIYPQKNIWCWTGYIYETDLKNPLGKKHTTFTDRMLSCIDILVDGPYIEAERDLTLDFRGSRNQRILNLREISA
ncbi:MAG: anaerobic ribonucleoside-triphosphate reductase activating protein [Treponema sp.]|nr:anaerobic ribonucleoside-triphosphate reductase activating protein [Treponema sp.]